MAFKFDIGYKDEIISRAINNKVNEVFGRNGILRGFRVEPFNDMTVKLTSGLAVIEGAYVSDSSDTYVTVSENNSGDTRTDYVCMEYNHEGEVVSVQAVEESEIPDSSNIVKIARIDVPSSASSIVSNYITHEKRLKTLDHIAENYSTIEFVESLVSSITKDDLGLGDVDNYSRDYYDQRYAAIDHTHSMLHEHENKSVIDKITGSDIVNWNRKTRLLLGETSDTAYRGDRGKAAYDHSLSSHAPSDAEKNQLVSSGGGIRLKSRGVIDVSSTNGHVEVSLASPGTITNHSSNSATSSGHTHNLSITRNAVGLGNVLNKAQLGVDEKAADSSKLDGNTLNQVRMGVTKSMVGLSNVLNKEQLGVDEKAADSSKLDGNTLSQVRSGVTKSNVGLSNVDNIKQAPKNHTHSAHNISGGRLVLERGIENSIIDVTNTFTNTDGLSAIRGEGGSSVGIGILGGKRRGRRSGVIGEQKGVSLFRAPSQSVAESEDGGDRAGIFFGDLEVTRQFWYQNAPTTVYSSNVRHGDITGRLFRVTSRRDSKTNIETYDSLDILKLRPTRFQSKSDVESKGEENCRYMLGFIAEEVEELGLTELVNYDKDGKIQSVDYDRFSAALLSVAKHQKKEIEELKAEIKEIKEKL